MIEAGVRRRVRVNRETRRRAPADLRDGVELWARKHGRSADLKWYGSPMNCWAVMLGFRPGDPRYAAGEKAEPVFLHEHRSAEWWAANDPRRARRHHRTNRIVAGYRAYELDELGLSGIIRILDRGDLASGRGEFSSAAEAGRAQVEKYRTDKHRRRRAARDEARHRATNDGMRRRLLKIPLLPVGIEFTQDPGE